MNKEYNWRSENWVPLFIKRIQVIDKVTIQLLVEFSDRNITIYAENNEDCRQISLKDIAQIREEKKFFIISIPKLERNLDIRVFKYKWDFINYCTNRISVRK